MRRLKLSLKLLYKLAVVGFLCLLSNTEEIAAAESRIEITGSKIKAGKLTVSFEARNLLSGKALEFLNKGFTLRLNYVVELWRSRSFWFDKLEAKREIEHIIAYDIVRREYSGLRRIGERISRKTAFKVERIVEWTTRLTGVEISQIDRLQEKAFYYYSISAELKMITADDIRDLRRWFSGFEEEGENILLRIITEFLVSQKAIRLKTESEKFHLLSLFKRAEER